MNSLKLQHTPVHEIPVLDLPITQSGKAKSTILAVLFGMKASITKTLLPQLVMVPEKAYAAGVAGTTSVPSGLASLLAFITMNSWQNCPPRTSSTTAICTPSMRSTKCSEPKNAKFANIKRPGWWKRKPAWMLLTQRLSLKMHAKSLPILRRLPAVV